MKFLEGFEKNAALSPAWKPGTPIKGILSIRDKAVQPAGHKPWHLPKTELYDTDVPLKGGLISAAAPGDQPRPSSKSLALAPSKKESQNYQRKAMSLKVLQEGALATAAKKLKEENEK